MQISECEQIQAPYMAELNPAQREAVETTEGAVLVLAGAGTGKTRALTTRLAHLINENYAFPGEILAVTFTNKAAQEMRERVSALLGGTPVEGWWLGTFHALAARMLRSHAELVGLKSNFTILDPDDQNRLLKQIMESENIDHKKWAPKAMMSIIDRWKDRGRLPSDLGNDEGGDAAGGLLAGLYGLYQARLKVLNACDFGDLLLHMVTIFKNPAHKDILAEYHRRFKYILVDEYQDTNVVQYLWLRLLAQGTGNICCVGDDDQSIYGWRGAEVKNILKFEKDFPGAKIIRLEQNYRSTGHILATANGIIAKNKERLGKNLFTGIDDGEKVILRGLWDGPAEARWVSEEIEQLQHKNWSLRNMAVLMRTGFQTREFEERFIQLGLNYRVIGGQRFYERKEIRDALAYLRVIVQPSDDLALERIINLPKRGLGSATIQTLYAYGRSKGICLHDAIMDLTQGDELRPKVKTTLMKLLDDFARWRSLMGTMPHTEITALMLDESGYLAMWRENKDIDAPGRVENLKELVSSMEEFEDLPSFLEHIALVMEVSASAEESEYISLMTLHGAKGLEFDAVFLPGWEEGLFPSQRSMDEKGITALEEERRLAYVGITRARKRSFISFVGNRLMYGKWMSAIPSRFVDELPAAHIEIQSDTGIYQGRSRHWDSSGGDSSGGDSSGFFAPARAVECKVVNEAGVIFSRGDRVLHDKFGEGTILHIDGHKLDIAFDSGGKKRVMDSFVETV